ncbi:MAG: hypothetical protein LC737_04720 [Chloroflexi bacterium]|nr:hypothetical protein [Chloroflexota bacterium]
MISLASLGALGTSLAADLPAPDALITRASPDTTKIYDRKFRTLPARVWQIYFPDVQGRSEGARFEVLP